MTDGLVLHNYEKRKKEIRAALEITEDDEKKYADLKSWVCPFFKNGEYSPCIKCRVEEYDLDQCTEYFLDRIDHYKMNAYKPAFDLPIARTREKVKLEDIQDIGMTCNSCYMSEKCPSYEKHAACGIDFGEVPPGNTEKLDKLIEMQYARIKRAQTFELVDGGVPDTNLSVEMDRLTGMISMKDNLGRDRLSVSIEASGGGAAAGGGVLAQLFGAKPAAPAVPTQDVTHVEIQEVKTLPTANVEFVPDNIVDSYNPERKRKTAPPPPKRKQTTD